MSSKAFIFGIPAPKNDAGTSAATTSRRATVNDSQSNSNNNDSTNQQQQQQQLPQQLDETQHLNKRDKYFASKETKSSAADDTSNNSSDGGGDKKLTFEQIKQRREQFRRFIMKEWDKDEERNDSQLVLGLCEPLARLEIVLPEEIQSEQRTWRMNFPTKCTVDQVKVS
jgi:hypothetical protein